MKRELLPYYVSRAILAILLGYWIALDDVVWLGALLGTITFAGFIWYAHSGRYLLDLSTPLYPLRRDKRGEAIRDRAVLLAVTAAFLFYAIASAVTGLFSLAFSVGAWAFVVGAVAYFAVSNWLYLKG